MKRIKKAVILAGGYGSRISEESYLTPKPMIEVAGYPIILHIMKIFYHYQVDQFIICGGYKINKIKDYFLNYSSYRNDISIDTFNNKLIVHDKKVEKWKITIVDTGLNTSTGGRLKRVYDLIKDDTFFFTYGDGLADINLRELNKFHFSHNCDATITAVSPKERFGVLNLNEDNLVKGFEEKPNNEDYWINGGFFVLNPNIIDLIDGDNISWENEPIKKLIEDKNIAAYKHKGFWHPMDTIRDKNYLNELYKKGNAPWIKW